MNAVLGSVPAERAADGGADERHEVKFAAYATEYSSLRHWVRMHPEGFASPYPDRQVNNVYFDTWDYRAYAENLAGVSQRSKLRYRWYGESAGPGAGTLEVKHKRNHFGWKTRFPLPQAPWSEGDSWTDVRNALRTALPLHARLWLDQNPQAVMLNRYSRQYFATTDGRVRITIDRDQQVFDQRQYTEVNYRTKGITQDTLVVEIKFARADRQRAAGILTNIPVRIGRHSKYMNAVRAISFA